MLTASASSNVAAIAGFAAAAAIILCVVVLAGRRLPFRRGSAAALQPPGPATVQLEVQALHQLVETDDAVKTSDQELSFAVARFGEHAARPFSAALKRAQAELAAAFKLSQLLDDDVPETEPIKRSMLMEISSRCAVANRLLDEQSEAFDQLQDLQARAPEVLAEVDHHVTQQAARVSRSEETLGSLAATYTSAAVAVVSSSPGQASERLEFSRSSLAEARQALDATETDQAAVFLQAAESAADQAESLLDGIGHLEAELTQAASALPAALREIDVEIAEATELLAGKPDDRAAAVTRAQVAAAAVRGQMSAGESFDALAALRQLAAADAALDQTLARVRPDRDREDRARAVLDQAMLVARSAITAAEDFITTRRGGVGAAARTRLAEAHRHFQLSIASAQDDAEAAVNEAQHADALAQQARWLAEQDVATFSHGELPLGGAVLGGILIDSQFDGGASAEHDGSEFGLGGSGTPGSFGGTVTRGRHSIVRRLDGRPSDNQHA